MIVFDFDGTLSNSEERVQHFLKGGDETDWDSFYDHCGDDEPNLPILNLFQHLVLAEEPVEIWTGRVERVREISNSWLWRHAGVRENAFQMRMRPDGLFTPDHELKLQWLNERVGDPVTLVFEDRKSVVDMFRAQGITVCQVAEGDF